MRPAELFGVVVRTIGLLLVLSSFWMLLFGLLGLVLGGPGEVVGLLFYGLPVFLLGIWLLCGAKSLVRIAYPDDV